MVILPSVVPSTTYLAKMVRLIFLAGIIWFILFALRVAAIGGVDPTYKEEGNLTLAPLQGKFSQTISGLMPNPQSALLSGILIGDGSKIPFSLKNDLKATSTIHLVVVSGQNLTILAGFVMTLATLLGRRATILITLLVIIFYSLLTGLQVPIMRAAVMATLVYLAQIFGRQSSGVWVLFLTAAGMLLYNPNWLLNISFQLSFLATMGVVAVAPVFLERLKVVPKLLREDFAVSLAAQLLTLPVIAYNFGQMSLIGILVNSLILWTTPILMVSGFAALGVGMVNQLAGQVVGVIPGILLTYFVDVVRMFAHAPGAGMVVGESSVLFWLGYYLIIGAVIWGMGKGRNMI